jgi:hypothetical protein
MLEETGMQVKAVRNFLDIEELFDVWKHINHYFVCELIEDTGSRHLTEAEESAGCTYVWKPLDEALEIFGNYEDYHESDIAVYGLYKREYKALEAYMEYAKKNQIDRIRLMEEKAKRLQKALDQFQNGTPLNEEILSDVQDLERYYETVWRDDFEDDEKGKFPPDLKRGILSEDMLYNLLADFDAIKKV